jgi:hypothetical protein
MKETLIKLLTGALAKGVRYALTMAGGAGVVDGATGETYEPEKLAAGIAAVVVPFIWSIWEDRVKKRKAESNPLQEMPTTPTTPKTP